jgi:NAD+ kinase
VTAESRREMLLVAHNGRADVPVAVRKAAEQFASSGVAVRVLDDEADELGLAGANVVPAGPEAAKG